MTSDTNTVESTVILSPPVVAAVVPCYREKSHIGDVLNGIGEETTLIYVIDDACPDGTGDFVEEQFFCVCGQVPQKTWEM